MDIKQFKALSDTVKNDIRFKIIEHYRNNTWIINIKHHLYQDRKYRNTILKDISEKLNLTVDCVPRIWKSLSDCYRRKRLRQTIADDQDAKSEWMFFEAMQFTDDFGKRRKHNYMSLDNSDMIKRENNTFDDHDLKSQEVFSYCGNDAKLSEEYAYRDMQLESIDNMNSGGRVNQINADVSFDNTCNQTYDKIQNGNWNDSLSNNLDRQDQHQQHLQQKRRRNQTQMLYPSPILSGKRAGGRTGAGKNNQDHYSTSMPLTRSPPSAKIQQHGGFKVIGDDDDHQNSCSPGHSGMATTGEEMKFEDCRVIVGREACDSSASMYPCTNTERLMQVLACDIDSVGSDLQRTRLLKSISDAVHDYKVMHLEKKEQKEQQRRTEKRKLVDDDDEADDG